MSALQPPDPQGGIIDSVAHYAPIGAAAALVRTLLSEEPRSFGYIARHTLAASITAWIVGPAFAEHSPIGLASACTAAVSYNSVVVWDWVGKKAVALVKGIVK